MQTNPTLTWGGQYKNITEIQIPLHNAEGILLTEGISEIQLLDPIVDNSQYVVRAHVVDSYGCHGEDGNFTYLVGKYFGNSSKNVETCSLFVCKCNKRPLKKTISRKLECLQSPNNILLCNE